MHYPRGKSADDERPHHVRVDAAIEHVGPGRRRRDAERPGAGAGANSCAAEAAYAEVVRNGSVAIDESDGRARSRRNG